MKTIKITNQVELDAYKANPEPCNIDMAHLVWQSHLDMSGMTIKGSLWQCSTTVKGNLDQSGMTVDDSLDQQNMTVEGKLDQRGMTVKNVIDQNDITIKTQVFRTTPTPEEIDFLKRLPLDLLDMRYWQSNDNWISAPDIHTCDTTYCIRGYAEAEYYHKHGHKCKHPNKLLPNLQYMFHLNEEEALKEIEKLTK